MATTPPPAPVVNLNSKVTIGSTNYCVMDCSPKTQAEVKGILRGCDGGWMRQQPGGKSATFDVIIALSLGGITTDLPTVVVGTVLTNLAHVVTIAGVDVVQFTAPSSFVNAITYVGKVGEFITYTLSCTADGPVYLGTVPASPQKLDPADAAQPEAQPDVTPEAAPAKRK